MSKPVFNPSDVLQLSERADAIRENYYRINHDSEWGGHHEAITFLSFFQAYCELTGRQNPQ